MTLQRGNIFVIGVQQSLTIVLLLEYMKAHTKDKKQNAIFVINHMLIGILCGTTLEHTVLVGKYDVNIAIRVSANHQDWKLMSNLITKTFATTHAQFVIRPSKHRYILKIIFVSIQVKGLLAVLFVVIVSDIKHLLLLIKEAIMV